MSKFWSKIMMCLVAVFVIGINNADADLQCVAQPSCAMLGYSKANVENCTGYIHCPFDTSYKKCVTLDHTDGKCTGYSLTECPPHAKCEPCGSYKITSCRDGYKISGNTCICATTCTDRLTQNDIPLNAGPIKQSCDACGAISDIITGWECNSGYVNVNDECKKYYDSCEDAGFVPNKPDNATCSDQIVYLANADALKCYSGCACNDGYVNVGTDIDSGMICEQFIDCSAYTLDKCPDNADCGTCTDNWGKTTYQFNKCNSGYAEQSGACVCEKVCLDKYIGTIPANATAVKEVCEACGVATEIVTGWTCNSGYVKAGDSCRLYYGSCAEANQSYLTSPKANATCSEATIYLPSGSTSQCYYDCKCNNGYKDSAGVCTCEKVCSDAVTTKPANSHFNTETCVACGVSSTIKTGWTCDDEYKQSGNNCVCAKTCANTFNGSIPENGKAVTEQCTACGVTTTIITDFNCNSGFHKNGNVCSCDKVCKDEYTGGIPANATATKKTCTACDKNYDIITGWTCNNGYNKSGDKCVCEKVCLDKYIGTIPANATAVQEMCTACGVNTMITTGFTCNSGYVKVDNDCKKYYSSCEQAGYLTNQKANATCSTASIYLSNGSTKTCYKDCKCDSGYVDVNGTCKLYYSSCEAAGYLTSQKANATCSTASIYLSNGSTKTCYTNCKCNTNYADVNGTCQASHNTCEAAGYLTNPKANATCSTASIYLADGSQKTCYTACKCNNGYTGDPCVCATTCSDKITTKPENSHFNTETCTACGVSSTIKTGWSCDTGYHTSGNTCVCDKTCTDQITSKPANSSFTTTTCAACGKNYTINIGWSCNSGYTKIGNACEKIVDCSAHTLTSCPSNAVCSSCTSNSGSNAGKTTYKFENCANNYTLKSGVCVCATTCSDRVSSKPDNSTYTTTNCTACGVKSTIKTGWACNTGYTQSGNSCVCATSCTDQVTSKPANSSYKYTSCTACGSTKDIATGWTCNSGYVNVGGVCQKYHASCEDAGYTTSQKANATCGTTSIYLANGSTKNCYTNSCTCNTNYVNVSGTCQRYYASCSAYNSSSSTSALANASCNTASIYLSTGKTQTCYYNCNCNSGYVKVGGICQKYYSSCEAANYLSSPKANATCGTASIYLANGSTKTCYTSNCTCNSNYVNVNGTCQRYYASCSAYNSSSSTSALANASCSTASIYLSTGKTQTCYYNCNCNSNYVKVGGVCQRYYSSCSAYNSSYLTSPKANSTCKSTNIYTSSGNQTTCYYDCTCNTNYVNVSGTCQRYYSSCSAYNSSYSASALANASCNTASIYLSTGKTQTCYYNCNCNSGYVKVGGVCQKYYSSCSAYNSSYSASALANASCSTASIYLSTGKTQTCYYNCNCNSGYVKVGGVCQKYYSSCSAYNSSYSASALANASCSTASIYLSTGKTQTCYYNCNCNSGYVKVGGVCQRYYASCEAAGYLTSAKANANCSTTSIYLSSGSTKTCYTGCSCKSGYTTNSAGNCVCATTCADKYTGTLPAHAHYDTETCTACGVSSTIKTGWSCHSGYVKVGNTCQKYYSSCEAAGYLTNPKSNATCSTASIYLSSGSTKTCYSGCTCKSGYTGDPCVCATTCADKVTSKPTNASWSYESCTACGSSYSIKSGWTCNTGYVKSGNDCVCPSGTYRTQSACESANPYSNCTLDVKCYKPTSCKSGYGKSTSDCGTKVAGWSLGLTDNYGCSQCNKNSCPSISKTVSSSSTTTATVSIQTSTDSDVANCGTTGSSGYTLDTTSYYSGDSLCYACTPKACPSGYTPTNQLTCSGLAQTSLNSYFGEDTCSTCRTVIKRCLAGTYPTKEECENSSSDSGLIKINSQTSTYAAGTLEPIIGRNLCTELSNGCWQPATVTKTCSAYTLPNCPTGGICSSCETTSGTKMYKFDSCKTNYIKSGDKCVSCASQQSTFKNYNTIAKNSYLNCCSDRNIGGKCRQNNSSDCTNISLYGSWFDGCLPYKQTSIDTLYTDLATFKKACNSAMQDIADSINDFNNTCPNYKITNVVSPTTQCNTVIINGLKASPSYNSDSSKMGCSTSLIGDSDWDK